MRGVDICRDVIKSQTMKEIGAEMLESEYIDVCKDRAFDTRDFWLCYMRATLNTIYHPVGTAQMGRGGASVVDSALRVRGVQGLRVVDASVMPFIPSANTHAGVVMIAEKISDVIRGREPLQPEDD